MQDEQKTQDESQVIDELEQVYRQTISSNSNPVSNSGNLGDEKQKISNLLVEINKLLEAKKGLVEKKLAELKTLKSEIESGLDELKKIESKKVALDGELSKIKNIEEEERKIEAEVANISAQI